MKTLIIVKNSNMYYFDGVNNPGIEIQPLFKPKYESLGVRTARVLTRLNYIAYKIYGSWYKRVSEYKRIVVFDTCLFFDSRLLERLSRVAKTKDLYLYGWNIDYSRSDFMKIKELANRSGFRYYSYDKNVCTNYGLEFNTIMFDIDICVLKRPIKREVIYLGKAKDRYNDVALIADALSKENIKSRIIVVDDQIKSGHTGIELRRSYVKYPDYLNLIAESNVILDVVQENQVGYSMRTMEALYLGKKLISTNRALITDPLYDTGNILVVDPNRLNRQQLIEFISRPLSPYPKYFLEYYSIQDWLSRFQQSSSLLKDV